MEVEKNMKEDFKSKLKYLCNKMIVKTTVLIISLTMLYQNTVYASIQKSIYVTGTRKLILDAIKAIQLVGGVAGVLFYAWLEFKKRYFSSEHEEESIKKTQKGTLITVVVIETILTFANLILGYYGVKV